MNPEDLISKHFRLKADQKIALTRLKLFTLEDLLLYLPQKYLHQGDLKHIHNLESGETTVIWGKVVKANTKKAFKSGVPMAEAVIEDETGKINAIWFNQAFLAKKLIPGLPVKLSGKISERAGKLYLTNPDISFEDSPEWSGQTIFGQNAETNYLIPVYPTTAHLSSGWFYYHIQKILSAGVHKDMTDPISAPILKKYHLPTLSTALVWLHNPQKSRDADMARKRFAFEEVFYIQLDKGLARREYRKHGARKITTSDKDIKNFIDRFPFKFTKTQAEVTRQIVTDLKRAEPMTRLLEGDVGSGKTAIAAAATFATVASGLEVAYMVPTEILARQHFASFISYFAHMGISVGLMTGKECRKFPSKVNPHEHTHISRPQLLKWVSSGDIPIVIGTHTLMQKSVTFRKLGLAIIDEQHRFGVMQRKNLLKDKDSSDTVPHLLSMTATPIPRTLALAIFGDLDLSVLDELPPGRKPIVTKIIAPDKRQDVYEQIRSELQSGRQAYVICPRIDEPDPEKVSALQMKAATTEARVLQTKVFPEFKVGLIHSKMLPAKKESVMEDFIEGDIDILVATSVIEVGVNVPNATVIIIEGAERFGLAQIHQLRGRVMRSSYQPYCFLFSDTNNKNSFKRLEALTSAKTGFDLAELDLSLRGTGGLSSTGKQWGVSDVGMEAIKNIKMVEAARQEARLLIDTDPEFKKHPLLKIKLAKRKDVHLE